MGRRCCTRRHGHHGRNDRLHRLLNIAPGYSTGTYGRIDGADDGAVQEWDQKAGCLTRWEHPYIFCRCGLTVGRLLGLYAN
jgi:hypothetical protein